MCRRALFAILVALFGCALSVDAKAFSPGELQYYCSLGSQTPRSVRPYCGGYAPRYQGAPRYRGRERYGNPDFNYYNLDPNVHIQQFPGQCGRGAVWDGYRCRRTW